MPTPPDDTRHATVSVRADDLSALLYIARYALGISPRQIRQGSVATDHAGQVSFVEVRPDPTSAKGWREILHNIRINPPTPYREEAHRDPQ